jgi:hypothetical protein
VTAAVVWVVAVVVILAALAWNVVHEPQPRGRHERRVMQVICDTGPDDDEQAAVEAFVEAAKAGRPVAGEPGRVHVGCFDRWHDNLPVTDGCELLLPERRTT